LERCIQMGIYNDDVQKFNRENLALEIDKLLTSII
jgi:hypothetical protein